jgi:hypothetical protein
MSRDEGWVPAACTLPTGERPLRMAEFDELFATALRTVTRLTPTALRWEFAVTAEARVRELAAREAACCAFFTFVMSTTDDAVLVDVRVPAGRAAVLDGLADRTSRRETAR